MAFKELYKYDDQDNEIETVFLDDDEYYDENGSYITDDGTNLIEGLAGADSYEIDNK